MSITTLNVYVNIPSSSCEYFDMICVTVSKVAGTNYTDNDSSNNQFCLQFGEVSEGYAGVLPCTGEYISIMLPLINTKGRCATVTLIEIWVAIYLGWTFVGQLLLALRDGNILGGIVAISRSL